ncbi:MAG: hypothetical protein JEY96_02570 [Bacteroidales bacterium]|nr:hypothetical protein [Bacteroidales bacterium]
MFQEKSDNTYTALVKQPEKSSKEKTLDTAHKNNQGQVDLTKELSIEEIALITQNDHTEITSIGVYTDSIADYKPGKYQEHVVVAEPQEKEEEKKVGYITSYVGDYVSNPAKNRIANLGKDVAFVQEHLNRLGILFDKNFIAEKPTTEEEISKSKIPQTIAAIEYFQREILSCKVDGEIWPGKGNIKSLVPMTLEQKDAKHLEYLKKKKEQEKIAAAEKAKAEAEAKVRVEEGAAIVRESMRRMKISLESAPNKETVLKYREKYKSDNEFGKFLKDYALYNPKFIEAVYDHASFAESDNLTRAIMKHMSDAEIASLTTEVDELFYDSLDSGWTVDEEYALMDKLKAGKKIEEGKEEKKVSKNVKDEAAKDLQTVRGIVTYQLQGSVGGEEEKKAVNNIEDVKQTANRLKEKKYTVTEKSIEEGLWDTEFKEAIGKLQTDNGLVKKDGEPDYIISVGFGTYKALFDYEQYSSGLDQIYADRTVINAKFETKFNSDLEGDVGNDLEENKAENKKNDIKLVAKRLKNHKIKDVPKEALSEGEFLEDFVKAIKSFQKKIWPDNDKPDGNITKGGSTDKKLADFKVLYVDRLYRENYTDYSDGESNKEYYSKIDSLRIAMGIKENSEIDKILDIAQKASINQEYYSAITSGVSVKMLIESKQIDDGNTRLSSVLQDRMERFHKFLVTVGFYKGNMLVNSAIRSKEKAHQFAVQYHIIVGNYKDIIKNNLMEMAKKDKLNEAIGKYGEVWAKKEHFTFNKKGEITGIKYAEIKKFVKSKDVGRPNKKDPAAAGHSISPDCLPLPAGLGVSNHTKGLAMDIDQESFIKQKDAIVDLIGLLFGVVRAGGWEETWHYELSDLGISQSEMKLIKSKKR